MSGFESNLKGQPAANSMNEFCMTTQTCNLAVWCTGCTSATARPNSEAARLKDVARAGDAQASTNFHGVCEHFPPPFFLTLLHLEYFCFVQQNILSIDERFTCPHLEATQLKGFCETPLTPTNVSTQNSIEIFIFLN